MAKRRADTELNHDNWNQDLSDEEQGTFRKASDADLAKRKIKVAKRRGETVTTGGPTGPSVFKNFGGFGGMSADSGSKPSFNFGAAFAGASPKIPSFGSSDTKAPSFGGSESKSPAFAGSTPKVPSFGGVDSKSFAFGGSSPKAPTFGGSTPKVSTFGGVESKSPAFGGVGSQSPSFGGLASKSLAASKDNSSVSFSFGPGSPKLPEKHTVTSPKAMFEATSFKMSADSSPSASPASTSQHNKENSKPSSFGGNFPTAMDSKKALVEAEKNSNDEKTQNVEYLSSLKSLNEGVLKHMKKHLDDNVFINLTPVFNDYIRHFDALEKKHKPKFSSKSSQETAKTSSLSSSADTSITFGTSKPKAPDSSVIYSPIIKSSAEMTGYLVSRVSPLKGVKPSATDGPRAVVKGPGVTIVNRLMSTPLNDVKPEAVKSSTPSASDKLRSVIRGPGVTIVNTLMSTPHELSDEKSGSDTNQTSTFSFGGSSSDSKPSSGFSFGGGSGGLTFGAKDASAKPAFSFATKDSGFSFGASAAGSSTTSGFSFGSAPLGAKPAESSGASGEADEDAPPKLEVVEHQEEGSVFDKRCKLFYKKDGAYVDKGVGTIYLKPVPDSNKTQLLVRAATSLGNVLLNIMLSAKMPTQRQGKNNVVIICVPNPPVDAKANGPAGPVTMLIRVKTGDDADALLAKINELKEKNK